MKAVRVSEEKLKKRKANSFFCCLCCDNGSDTMLSSENSNEPYEYIVEKLVIKRVPVAQFATQMDMRRKLSNLTLSNDCSFNKSVITLTSYCQIDPADTKELNVTCSNKNTQKPSEIIIEKPKKITTEVITEPDTKQKMTNTSDHMMVRDSNVKPKLQDAAQIHKSLQTNATNEKGTSRSTQNKVLFVKQMSTRVVAPPTPQPADQAVIDTIQKLAAKKQLKNSNRRLIHRDPKTGQIREIFKNSKIDEPMKLEQLCNETSTNIVLANDYPSCGDHDKKLNSSSQSLKWKIIIKHKNGEKHKTTTATTSSDCAS